MLSILNRQCMQLRPSNLNLNQADRTTICASPPVVNESERLTLLRLSTYIVLLQLTYVRTHAPMQMLKGVHVLLSSIDGTCIQLFLLLDRKRDGVQTRR